MLSKLKIRLTRIWHNLRERNYIISYHCDEGFGCCYIGFRGHIKIKHLDDICKYIQEKNMVQNVSILNIKRFRWYGL